MLYAAQQFLNGFHSAALYALLAFGYALMFGLHRRVDFAYGGLYALCGQLTVLGAVFGYRALWMTLPAALAFGAGVAVLFALILQDLLARRVLVPLFDTTPNAIAAASLGWLIVLTELGRIASDSRDWWLPPLGAPLAIPLSEGRLFITPVQVAGIVVAIALIAAGHALLR
ncbi:MAG: branched-chain amino acid ABC transporter permease, partial [Rhizobiaceae bacterium]